MGEEGGEREGKRRNIVKTGAGHFVKPQEDNKERVRWGMETNLRMGEERGEREGKGRNIVKIQAGHFLPFNPYRRPRHPTHEGRKGHQGERRAASPKSPSLPSDLYTSIRRRRRQEGVVRAGRASIDPGSREIHFAR